MLSPFLITVDLVAADRSVGGAPESLGDGIGEVMRTGARGIELLQEGAQGMCLGHGRAWRQSLFRPSTVSSARARALSATAAHGRLRGHRPLDRLARLSRAGPAQRRRSIA